MTDKKIYNMRPHLMGRNGRIWAAHTIGGCNLEQLAEAFNLTPQRISQILDQVRKAIPVDERDAIKQERREVLNELKAMCMEMALADPAPAFAPNGKPHYDPETRRAVRDYSTRLQAIDRLLKIDERIAKMTGTDHAVEHTVQVSAEAQQATKDSADKVGMQFAAIIPMSPEVRAHVAGKGG